MLVLTRRVDESIRIGDDIRITVVKIKVTQQICVGVDAPRDVPVLREELLMEVLKFLTTQNLRTRNILIDPLNTRIIKPW